MGVNVQRYKARAFIVSSMYAGLSGVLYALSIGSIAPESFGLDVSVQYLAMIVLGGLGSVGRVAASAPSSSARFPWSSSSTPGRCRSSSSPASPGSSPSQAAAFLYGAAIVLVVLFEPAGLVGLAQPLAAPGPCHRARRPQTPHQPISTSTAGAAQADSSTEGDKDMKKTTKRGSVATRRRSPSCWHRLQHQGVRLEAAAPQRRWWQGRSRHRRQAPSRSALLTDLTGVFAALGKDITNAQALYWKNQNSGDKVCGKYTVKAT